MQKSQSNPKKRRARLIYLLALILFAVFLYADQRIPVCDRYEIPVKGLSDSFDGLKIVQLSDLHGAELGKDNAALVEMVEREAPDLIALTGDFVGAAEEEVVFESLLPRLQTIAPCYYVSGNHEWASGMMGEAASALKENGVEYLNNRYVFFCRGEEKLCLCGVEDPNSYAEMISPGELVEQLHEKEGDIPVIFLGHRNDWPEKWPDLDVDVILCGHGHGGILRVPGVGGLLGGDRKLFPRYSAGLFEIGEYTMVVSRGLGNIHHIPRLFNFPEVVSITLRKAA